MDPPKIRVGLQGKFALFSTALLLALTVALTGLNIGNQQRFIEQRMFDKANAMASLLAETVWDGLATLNIRELKFALDDVLLQEEVRYVYVFDEIGRVLADGSSENHLRDQVLQDPLSRRAIAADDALLQVEADILDVAQPIYRGREKLGGIRIGFSLERMHAEVNTVRDRNILFGAGFLLIGLVLTSLMVRRVTAPLSKLIEGIETVSKGQFDGNVVVNTNDELNVLAGAFNRMVQDLKNSRQALARSKEREAMMQLKGTFFANMSHEFRTPLTSILGFAQILIDEVPEHQREFVEMITQSGNRLLGTLNRVIDLARLDADMLTINPEALPLAEAVEDVVRLLQPLAATRGLQIRTHVAAPELTARLDRVAFYQILNHVIDNAIKFTEEGTITVTLFDTADHACVRVRDTGRGISRAFLPYLFDDFTQESTGQARSHEGSGLGLTIAKRLIDLMDGDIAVESVVGQGSTFTIRFPLLTEVETPPAVEKPAVSPAAETPSPQGATGKFFPIRTLKGNL